MALRKPVKRAAAKKVAPAPRVVSPREAEMRAEALRHAVAVSGIEHTAYGGGINNQFGLQQHQGLARSRYEQPAVIIKTAESFLAFLRGQ